MADVGGFAESQDVVTVTTGLFRFQQRGLQAVVSLSYRLNRRTTLSGSFRFDDLRTEGESVQNIQTWQNYTAYIGLRYDFDPFRF